MYFVRYIFLITILTGTLLQNGQSQVQVINQSVINSYTSIDSIYSFNDNNVDSLIVESTAGFSTGDTVMVYVVQGAAIETTDTFGEENIGRDKQAPTNCGKYAFLIIDAIVEPRNLVILNSTVQPDIDPLGPGEVAQLIRVPSYRRARLVTELTAPEWDGSTGGVVAMFVQRSLTLDADINVTGKGFRGARGSTDVVYDGTCTATDTVAYDSMFYDINNPVIRAGLKGEGTTDTTFDLLRGKARNINGGGGGNGRLSGGGGGSNYSSGGSGGNESSLFCGPGVDAWGVGGFALASTGWYYINGNPLNRGNRIFFGGGGGSGTRVSGRTSTDGGDGGGLVIIVADSVIGNGNSIIADGESVTNTATGAGGGGGGGGGIVLDVNEFGTTLNLRAVGGKGGDTYVASDTTGPGGGGGGGFYWIAGTTHTGVNAEQVANGQAGRHLSAPAISYGASNGGSPGKINNLRVPLRGFLFNTVPDRFTVCSDVVPETLLASVPKGGTGTYSYLWIDSTRSDTWQPAPGTNNQQNYTFPDPLDDTTYFRRIVTSGPLPADTSFRITYNVHPEITGNLVSAPDTVCSGNVPELFLPAAKIGGGLGAGSYSFLWQKDEGTGTWTDAEGANRDTLYQAPGLTVTTDFVRITYSGVCVDTSAALKVQVWEPLTGNVITPFDTVCFNTSPDLISGPEPGEGDPGDKRYRWESSTDTLSGWSEIPGAAGQSYQSPELTQTTYIRRVALSGSDDACIDVSAPVEVLNIPLITGNTISGTHTVCRGDQASLLGGSDPGGGYQGQYSYRWEARTLSTGWVQAPGTPNVKSDYDAGIMAGDTTFFRRIVGSGGSAREVCLDTSNTETIHVLPPITNNVITTADDILCQGDLLKDIVQNTSGGPEPGGGATVNGIDTTRIYKWEVAEGQESPGTWQEIEGETSIDYTGQPLLSEEDDRWYRRIIFSGPGQQCKDTSDLQAISIHREISTNNIEPFDSVCFGDTRLLTGATPSGEPGITPVYTWRDLNSGNDIPDSDTVQYTDGPYGVLGSYGYERIAQIGECTDTSNTMQVTVMQLPGGRLTDNAYKVCEQDTLFAIDLNMDELETYGLPWNVTLTNGVDTLPIGPFAVTGDGNLPVTLSTQPDSILHNYKIASITYSSFGDRYTCAAPPDSISGEVPVWIFRKPVAAITPSDSVKVCDITVTLTGDPDHGLGTWSQVNTDLPTVTFSDPNSETTAVFIQDISERFGRYRLKYRSVAGDCYGEDSIDVHFFEQPEPAYAGEDTMIFFINSIQLEADPPTAGIGTWELVSGSGLIQDEHAPETYAYELALGEENTFRWTVENGEDEGKCVTYSDVVIVIRNEVKRYTGFSPNGDTENEYYIMQGLKYADEFTFTVFNALGNLVKEITHENVDELEVDEALIAGGLKEDEMVVWDGRAANGNLVPSGTYYYVCEFILHQRDPVTGNITRTDSYDLKDYVVVKR